MSRPALVPELYVTDLPASLAFYVDLLGFRVEYERTEDKFAALSLGDAHIMLEEAASLQRATQEEFARGRWLTSHLERPFGRGMNLEIEVPDIEPPSSRISAAGYPFLLEPHDKSYRVDEGSRTVRQLLVADPDGYLVRLSQLISVEGP